MANLLTVLGILVTLLIALFPYLRKTFFQGPEITIEFKRDGGSSSPIAFSEKNVAVDGVYEMKGALRYFRLTWNFEIIIRNNSEYTAYYPKIKFAENYKPFLRITTLNEQEPIPSKGQVILKATYQEIEETIGEKRNDLVNLPIFINELHILLEYKNASKRTFFTYFKVANNTYSFLRKKPKIFRNL